MRTTTLKLRLLPVLAAAALSLPAWSQQTTIRRIQHVRVKPDHLGDFVSAVKDYNETLKKVEGFRAIRVFSSITGPNEFLVVREYGQWSELDRGPVERNMNTNGDLARANMRIQNCTTESSAMITESLPGLSLPRNGQAPPAMLRVARSRIRPDKIAEWQAVIKDEMLPAQTKAGVKVFGVSQVRFGAPTNDYYVVSAIEKWADAGKNGLREAMGADAYQRMVAKLTALTLSREINVYRYRPELSIAPEAGPTTSTGGR